MKGTDFLENMELVNPAYIEAADQPPKKKHWTPSKFVPYAAAAFLCLTFAISLPGIIFSGKQDSYSKKQETQGTKKPQETQEIQETQKAQEQIQTKPKENQEQISQDNDSKDGTESMDFDGPQYTWEFYYNEGLADEATRFNIPGYFTKILNEAEITLLTPGKQIGWMEYSGTAGFDGEGTFVDACLHVTSTIPDKGFRVSISKHPISCTVFEEATVSSCNGVDFWLYQYTYPYGAVSLGAKATINDLSFLFEMDPIEGDLSQAKADFEQLLECFTYYEESQPNFAAILPGEIPEWLNQTLTLEEAIAEPDFGKYFLSTVPDGYTQESIRRYQDQNSNYLSGLWTKGYDSLSWNVSAYQEEDATRLVSVSDTKRYDLSFYPIPLAESVPEELWEVVNNPIFDAEELTLEAVYARAYQLEDAGDSDGWRMNFSVKYGEQIVCIHAKGIEPEWIYQQLKQLL